MNFEYSTVPSIDGFYGNEVGEYIHKYIMENITNLYMYIHIYFEFYMYKYLLNMFL